MENTDQFTYEGYVRIHKLDCHSLLSEGKVSAKISDNEYLLNVSRRNSIHPR
jgi:hypothetical protein